VPKGGARINSGPPPDPNALRRDRPSDKDGWTLLPAGGFRGGAPEWPLLDDVVTVSDRDAAIERAQRLTDELAGADDRDKAKLRRALDVANRTIKILDQRLESQRDLEGTVWGELWRTPQAAVWVCQGWSRDVAQYVRHKVLGELGSLNDAKEARQWSDRLGLNPAAMLRNRWRIAPDEVGARRDGPAPATVGTSARDRFKVVRDGGA
jgi:hypothetical protein